MAEFTLKLRRYDPESGDAAYWEEHTVDLEPHRSVLEAILQAKALHRRLDRHPLLVPRGDLRVVRRARQRQARPRLPHAPRQGAARRARDGVIDVEPMGNMPDHQGPHRRHGRGPLDEDPARQAVA